jgi:homoserine kinase
MDDRLHLPFRLPLIPGGQHALDNAYAAGASAVTISGAGPSLIAFTAGDPEPVAAVMVESFRAHGVESRAYSLRASAKGAAVQFE